MNIWLYDQRKIVLVDKLTRITPHVTTKGSFKIILDYGPEQSEILYGAMAVAFWDYITRKAYAAASWKDDALIPAPFREDE